MTPIQKITRLAIFVDHDNFTISYCETYDQRRVKMELWENLSEIFTAHYQENLIHNHFEVIDHVGTYVCVGKSDSPEKEEAALIKRLQNLDRKNGFTVKYGGRQKSGYYNGSYKFGQELGVDSEIICQMLMGAYLDHYDACILMSDDADYIPVVTRIQDYFGKKVIHAGFQKGKLRGSTFANIPLEKPYRNLEVQLEA